MKTSAVLFAVGCIMGVALFGRDCRADELPTQSVCYIASELAYDEAVAAGDGLPDGAYERVQGDCEQQEAAPDEAELTLNKLIAVDGEPVNPVCKFTGGCK